VPTEDDDDFSSVGDDEDIPEGAGDSWSDSSEEVIADRPAESRISTGDHLLMAFDKSRLL